MASWWFSDINILQGNVHPVETCLQCDLIFSDRILEFPIARATERIIIKID